MKKAILTAVVMVALLLAFIVAFKALQSEAEERAVVKYLTENTEDEGEYTIAVYPFEYSNREGKFYLAFMIDDDGDYEAYIVQCENGEIDADEVWWK